MSLRILIKPDQIQNWMTERHGKPVRRRDTDADLAVHFNEEKTEFEMLSIDELIETMRLNHLVLLVDQEPDKTFHKFIQHG